MKLLFKLFQKKDKVQKRKANTITKKKNLSSKTNNEKVAVRKGEIGEYKINIQLDQLPKEYKHLEDIMIKNNQAKTGYSQIDHVLISPYGIFVIETKNYQGTVYGGKERKIWSVNGKFNLMNPFQQNYGHIQALKKLMDEEYHPYFISMVSFTKRCTFKLDDTELRKIASDELIVYDVELSEFINRKVYMNKRQYKEPLLTEMDIENVYNEIKSTNITDPSIRRQHVQSLKESNRKSTQKRSEKNDKCKICQKPVTEKVRKYCLSNKKFKGEIYCFEHQKTVGK
ncbi:nuclease-related domain-containing protein [Gracilibacillus sp. YIM 98692]|uniref:nuclease-related domain-containing protein n=1 Tax=Gracilibacillus sp. YIM 98692 TaxID=2663532 RepID=UPI0013D31E88|nr:nuclease-related domain-containing protein [Gracilibacillus sp. YIM 98692]